MEIKKNNDEILKELIKIRQPKIKPYFYDSHKNWWLWDSENYRWEMVDEVDVLNMYADATGEEINKPSLRSWILNELKQKGRRNKPLEAPKSWIQFKDTIVDIITGEEFEAAPTYFITNPLPYALGDSELTPTIDNL